MALLGSVVPEGPPLFADEPPLPDDPDDVDLGVVCMESAESVPPLVPGGVWLPGEDGALLTVTGISADGNLTQMVP